MTTIGDIEDELLRLATTDPGGFCEAMHSIGLALKGAVYRNHPSPFARAAREAGFTFGDVALAYGRIADEIAEAARPLEMVAEPVPERAAVAA